MYLYIPYTDMNPAQETGKQNDNWERLLGFIREELGLSTNLEPDTDLKEDLGLRADEAHEFLENFIAEFDLEVGNFVFSDYFGINGIGLQELFSRKRREKKRLTLFQLYLAMDKGSLM